jgi:hypothetical protein
MLLTIAYLFAAIAVGTLAALAGRTIGAPTDEN